MQKLEETVQPSSTTKLPVSVIIPDRNEARNLPRCVSAFWRYCAKAVPANQQLKAKMKNPQTLPARLPFPVKKRIALLLTR
jgi:hypothetical protein